MSSGHTTPPPAGPVPPAPDAAKLEAEAKAKAEAEAAQKRQAEVEAWANQTEAQKKRDAELWRVPVFELMDKSKAREEEEAALGDSSAFGIRSDRSAGGHFPEGDYHRQGSAFKLHLDKDGNVTATFSTAEHMQNADNYGRFTFSSTDKRAMLKEMIEFQIARGCTKITLDWDDPKKIDVEQIKIFKELMEERRKNTPPGATPIVMALGAGVEAAVAGKNINFDNYLHKFEDEEKYPEHRKAREIHKGTEAKHWYLPEFLSQDKWLQDFRTEAKLQQDAQDAHRRADSPKRQSEVAARNGVQHRALAYDLMAKEKLPDAAAREALMKSMSPDTLVKNIQELDTRIAYLEAAKKRLETDMPKIDLDHAATPEDGAKMHKAHSDITIGSKELKEAYNLELADLNARRELYAAKAESLPPTQKDAAIKQLAQSAEKLRTLPLDTKVSNLFETFFKENLEAKMKALSPSARPT